MAIGRPVGTSRRGGAYLGTTIYRYWVGTQGPYRYRSKYGELPFRVELTEGREIDVALGVSSAIAGSENKGGNIGDTVSGADYSTYRAAHFYGSYLGAEAL